MRVAFAPSDLFRTIQRPPAVVSVGRDDDEAVGAQPPKPSARPGDSASEAGYSRKQVRQILRTARPGGQPLPRAREFQTPSRKVATAHRPQLQIPPAANRTTRSGQSPVRSHACSFPAAPYIYSGALAVIQRALARA
jgi:hypothetical protein